MQKLLSDDIDDVELKCEKPKIKAIACGGRHNLVLTKDGRLFSFGFGQQGQLGNGNCKNILKPTQVQSFANKPI